MNKSVWSYQMNTFFMDIEWHILKREQEGGGCEVAVGMGGVLVMLNAE